jgi:spore photoproduct lyase
MALDYAAKFERIVSDTLFAWLGPAEQEFVRAAAHRHSLTLQELRQVCEAAVDLASWGEPPLLGWWEAREAALGVDARGARLAGKGRLLDELRGRLAELRRTPPRYPPSHLPRPPRPRPSLATAPSPRTLIGRCPCASPATVCCNLLTLDAVRGCGFRCSYCTIQTFRGEEVVFDPNLAAALKAIELPADRYLHLGTGQASDGLMWGNRHGVLDALCGFARARPRVLLELRTKAVSVAPLVRAQPPANLFPSWSLNTPTVAANEEHLAARPAARLTSARRAVDAGMRVAFHLHPVVLYEGWEEEYAALAAELVARFAPEEVLYVSLGTVAFIRPVMREIRRRGGQTRVLQMELAPGPHCKLTYPEETRIRLFSLLVQALAPWRGLVFQSLCLEPANVWQAVLGRTYAGAGEFGADLIAHLRAKLGV